MATYTVSSGRTSSGLTISSGSTLTVLNGGTAIADVILAGGVATISSGGTASGDVISSGGREIALAGGADVSATVSAGGTLVVSGSASVSGTMLSGGTIILSGSGAGAKVNELGVSGSGTIVVDNNAVYAVNDDLTKGNVKYVVSSGGTISGGFIDNKNVSVLAGGTIDDSTLSGGGVVISSGGTGSGDIISSGGLETVLASGSDTAVTVSAGGTLLVGGLATVTDVSISGGTVILSGSGTTSQDVNGVGVGGSGTIVVESGAVYGIYDVPSKSGLAYIVSSGGTVSGGVIQNNNVSVLSGGLVAASTISGGGVTVSSGGTASGDTVSAGGTLRIAAGATLAGTDAVSSGGTLVLGSLVAGGTAVITGGSDVVLSGGAAGYNTTISGFTSGSLIDLAGVPVSTITTVTKTANNLSVDLANGTVYTITAPGIGNYGYKLVSDGNGGTFYEVCFAEGTMIATPDGERAVETIAVGDPVSTLAGDRPVVWAGHRSVVVSTLRDPEAGWLVRIRRGAFAAGVPHRDLLVTAEHCIFHDGKLIPARMLVNGRSIFVDRTINAYTYYHLELERHGILFAEGLTAESYLDTGNRATFASEPVAALHAGPEADHAHRSWNTDAAAPLTVDRASVEPVWRALEERARAMGVAAAEAPVGLTDDPDLCVVVPGGGELQPCSIRDGRYSFMLPPNVGTVRLRSRSGRPSDTIGPFVDDRRQLGVLVGEVSAVRQRGVREIRSHLTAVPEQDRARPAGWHAAESGSAARWTDGDAELAVATGDLPELLEVQVLAAGPYRATPAPAAPAVARQA